MRNETTPTENNSVGIAPSVPWRVHTIRPLESYRLYVQFIDGLDGVIDLSQLITSKEAGVFSLLQDQTLFQSVYLNYGAVTWPGELDLAPDAMYEAIKEHGEWVLR